MATSTLKKSYSGDILRKLRNKIVAALKTKDMYLMEQYQLSKINEHLPHFTINIITKSPTDQYLKGRISAIKDALSKEIPGVELTELTKTMYRMDADVAYRALAGNQEDFEEDEAETFLPTVTNGNGHEKALPKVGRPKEGLAFLQEDVITSLKDHTKIQIGGAPGMGCSILPKQQGKREFSLRFRNRFTYLEGMRCLETAWADQIKIVDIEKFIISISTDKINFPKSQVEVRQRALDFFILLKQAIRVLDERAVVLSSWLDHALFPKNELLVQFSDAGRAVRAPFSFPKGFDVTKEGALVKIKVDHDAFLRSLKEKQIPIELPKPKKGLIITTTTLQNGEAPLVNNYVHMSTNYDEFWFLPFNRNTTNRHVLDIVESIKLFGVLTFVIVVETDCVDGKMKKWIADGQHRFKGFKYEGLPILYTKAYVTDVNELVRLIAKLNHTSRNWSLNNYLHAWSSLKIKDYQVLTHARDNSGLPMTLLLTIYEDTPISKMKDAKVAFCDGRFKIKDQTLAEKQIEYLKSSLEVLPQSRDLLTGLLSLIRAKGSEYNHDHMLKRLKEKTDSLPFAEGDELKTITNKFSLLYN